MKTLIKNFIDTLVWWYHLLLSYIGNVPQSMTTEIYVRLQIHHGYINEKGAPKKCIHCDSKDLREDVKGTINYQPCEIDIMCNNCNNSTGYWAYGHYQI